MRARPAANLTLASPVRCRKMRKRSVAAKLPATLEGLGAVMDADFPYLQKAPCISSVGGTSWVKDRSAKARGGTEAEMQA